jgi:hypothetical protein
MGSSPHLPRFAVSSQAASEDRDFKKNSTTTEDEVVSADTKSPLADAIFRSSFQLYPLQASTKNGHRSQHR